jgi:polyisoprenoid-binding protein YceI
MALGAAGASVDLAHDKVNEVVAGPENFDTAKYPAARYKGTLGMRCGCGASIRI